MGKSSAPPPPDYAAAAKAEGEASKEAAIFNTGANRVNQVGPDGSVTWSLRPGADPMNPQAGDYIQTTRLSGAQQGIYDSGNRITQDFLNTAEQGLGRVQEGFGSAFDTSGLPGLQSAPGVQLSMRAGVPRTGLSTNDYSADKQRVVDAMMSRVNPQFDEARSAAENRLLNSGIEKGTEAWNREMTRLDQGLTDARMQAELAGGQEQSRLAGLDLQNAQFANQAQGQTFAQQGQYDQLLNALLGRNAEFNNAARTQGIEEQAYLRSLPLNEVNALRTGSQVSSPQFQSYYTGGQAQGAPMFDAATAQGNYNMQAHQQRQGGMNALLGGLANMGAAWLSDIRLKTNLLKIGMHPSGVARYQWIWKHDGSRGLGVIAQELQAVRPDAVEEGSDGYLRVNYELIGGV